MNIKFFFIIHFCRIEVVSSLFNHFFFISQMVVPGSSYWNMGIGLVMAVDRDADEAALRGVGAVPMGEVLAGESKVDVVLTA